MRNDTPLGVSNSFPCPEDVSPLPGGAWVLSRVGDGRSTLARRPAPSAPGQWVNLGAKDVKVDEWGEIHAERDALSEADRLANNRARAVRRARTKVEQYVVVNKLSKMWTLTYANAEHDRAQVVRQVARFFEDWRAHEGKPFAYLYVLEPHPGGHGWHVHIAVPGWLFTDFVEVRRLWGRGRVRFDVSRSGLLSNRDYRRMSVYLSKYLSKTFSLELAPGTHRYECADMFVPVRVVEEFFDFSAARSRVAELGFGSVPVWSSDDSPDWTGPPCYVFEVP